MYDYLIVGSGLYGSICAYELNKKGYKVLVFEKRNHIAGNIYTEKVENINVHKYGAHIFHTNDKNIWEYINQFAKFNRFTNSPLANYKDRLYNLPFNLNTFYQLWGVKTPKEARDKIKEQVNKLNIKSPSNLEEKAISLVGEDIYHILIKGYTEKQWGKLATQLPAFIIERIPIRYTFDNNYFNDKYQGIPIGGYTQIIEKLLSNIDIKLNIDFLKDKEKYSNLANKVIYTGQIDAFFDYQYGVLEYRSLKFEHEVLNIDDYQGNAVINYTEYEIPHTRIIEHKHFDFIDTSKTVITKEFPCDWNIGDEAYYPINDSHNSSLYEKYKILSKQNSKVIFGGRLGEYQYYDMDKIIARALNFLSNIN